MGKQGGSRRWGQGCPSGDQRANSQLRERGFGEGTYVMTTGATLLVIMDLALLLWMLTVWKGLMLRDCLLSAIPLTWRLSSGEAADTGCGAALAVVPMLHKQL